MAAWLSCVLVVGSCLFAGVSAAAQGRSAPGALPPEMPEQRPWRVEFSNNNDNKLLGLGYYLTGGRDGDDFGRTHELTLRLSKTNPRGVRFTGEIGTQLFTRPNGRVPPITDEMGDPLYVDDDGNEGFRKREVYTTPDGRLVPSDEVRQDPSGVATLADGTPLVFHRQTYVDRNGQTVDLDESSAYAAGDIHHIGVVFHELNAFRLMVDNQQQGDLIYWRAGGAVVVSNRSRVGPGGTGQQVAFHRVRNLVFPTDFQEYDYFTDGSPVDVGPQLIGGAGLDKRFFARRWLMLRGCAEVDLMPTWLPQTTRWAGSRTRFQGRFALEFGRIDARNDPRASLAFNQQSLLFWTSGELLMQSSFEGVWFTRVVDVMLNFHVYWLSPANSFYRYNDTTNTTELGLRFKFGG